MKTMMLLFTLIFSLTAFSADKTKMISLNVSGMTCEKCVSSVEKALKSVKGVKEAKVDLKNKKATVTLATTTSSASLIKAVSDAGFTANAGESTTKSEVKKHSKSEGENCSDGCCGDDCATDAKSTKTKKTEVKKS